jgi:ubiquinone/menaquinone biosynthesis C-methylase UbiE
MGQRTNTDGVAGFYDRLAGDYDRMTGFAQRFVRERPFIKLLVDRHKITRAVDAGTGTGFHAILLGRLGVQVTALDLSPAMVAALASRVSQEGLPISPMVGAFEELPSLVSDPQDAVLSMGNTLAHAASPDDLLRTMKAFRHVLRPGGIIFVQMLNYKRILAAKEKILADKVEDGVRFIRWYVYEGDRIRFNITRERVDGSVAAETQSVTLSPFTDDDLRDTASRAGFTGIQALGSIALEPFDEERSRDCVVLAHVTAG